MPAVKPIPDNYPPLTCYLSVADAGAAIDYYGRVFGARERMRLPGPGGSIGHAELELGGSVLMLSEENPEMGTPGPRRIGGTPVTVCVYVEDVDAVYERAVEAGARPLRPLQDQFYGDRTGTLEDPFGHRWSISTHIEDVAPDEMARRAQAVSGA